jgi:hypothetical protein
MLNCEFAPSAPENMKLQGTIQAISRMNFYLWMYLAQEGEFEEAFDFVREKQQNPTPIEAILGITPWNVAMNLDTSFDDF